MRKENFDIERQEIDPVESELFSFKREMRDALNLAKFVCQHARNEGLLSTKGIKTVQLCERVS